MLLFALLDMDHTFANENVYGAFLVPAHGIVALWVGIGLADLHRRWRVRWLTGIVLPLAMLGLLVVRGYQRNDARDFTYAEDYATTVLATLPQDSVVFTGGDVNIGPMAYVHRVLGVRPDVELFNFEGYMFSNRLFPGGGTGGAPQLAMSGLPDIGTTAFADLTNLPAQQFGALFYGFSDTIYQGNTLPLGLGTFGFAGCTLYAAPDISVFVPSGNGSTSYPLALPNNTAMIGLDIFLQYFVGDPTAPGGAGFSNAAQIQVGN